MLLELIDDWISLAKSRELTGQLDLQLKYRNEIFESHFYLFVYPEMQTAASPSKNILEEMRERDPEEIKSQMQGLVEE